MTFIVFEGVDATGKTTIIRNIQTNLNYSGIISVTEFPKSYLDGYLTELEEKDPSLHLNAEINTPLAQTLVLAGAAAYKYETQIRNLLEDNSNCVLVDRYIYSVLAFQSMILQEEANMKLNDALTWLHQITYALPEPDLVIYLSSTQETIKARINGRGEVVSDGFIEFLGKVHESYLQVFDNATNVVEYQTIGTVESDTRNIIDIIAQQCKIIDFCNYDA